MLARVAISESEIGKFADCPKAMSAAAVTSKNSLFTMLFASNQAMRAKPAAVSAEAITANHESDLSFEITGASASPLGIPIAVAKPKNAPAASGVIDASIKMVGSHPSTT